MSEMPQPIHRKRGGSDRSFGLVFAGLFALLGTVPLLRGEAARVPLLVVAGAFLILSFAAPHLLKPLHRLWLHVGAMLQKIMTPLIMAVLYFALLSPIALVSRLAGRDALRLKWQPAADTYWIKREPPGPDGASMKNQF